MDGRATVTAALDRLPVAIVGFGSVGRGLADLVRGGAAGPVEVVGVLVRDPARYADIAADWQWPFVDSAEDLLALHPRVAVEAAGHGGLRQHAPALLGAGVDVIAISVGAFSDHALLTALLDAARAGGARLRVASGAIAGLDAIGAAAVLGLDEVTHTVRKPPASLLPAEDAREVVRSGQAQVVYEGPAREAARLFPENVNVTAAVSLAGLGLDRTHVRVIADPAVSRNTHEVVARGAFGSLEVRMQNVPSQNPKTGRIVAPSLARALRSYTDTLVIPA